MAEKLEISRATFAVTRKASSPSTGGEGFMEIVVLVLCIGLYFLPYIVAASNKKQNRAAIGALNFFLGWTIVGWVAALVWAISKDASQPAPQVHVNVPTQAPPLPGPQKKCPDCAEMILAEAKKCRFCGHEFGPAIPVGQHEK